MYKVLLKIYEKSYGHMSQKYINTKNLIFALRCGNESSLPVFGLGPTCCNGNSERNQFSICLIHMQSFKI